LFPDATVVAAGDAAVPVIAMLVVPTLATVAVSVFAPAAVPSVKPVGAAIPCALVVATAPVSVPPPPVTANVTDVPATGLPFASVTSTAGSCAPASAEPTVAVVGKEPADATRDAAPAVAVAVITVGLPVMFVAV
jgi:hypothetical protein